MKQRVKLAQALVGDPRLLLLDEPTNGLDPAGRTAMLELIARIGAEFGISILVASHLLGEIEQICDHLVAIDGGRLLRADSISSMTQASSVLLDRGGRRPRGAAGRARQARAEPGAVPARAAGPADRRRRPTTPSATPSPTSGCR